MIAFAFQISLMVIVCGAATRSSLISLELENLYLKIKTDRQPLLFCWYLVLFQALLTASDHFFVDKIGVLPQSLITYNPVNTVLFFILGSVTIFILLSICFFS